MKKCVGGTCLRVRERQEEDVRKVKKLGIDFKDAGGGDNLEVWTPSRCGVTEHQTS
jgi:hypothetical protein